MDFSPASLIPSILFSLLGFVVLSYGKKQMNFTLIALGVTLMFYSYFTPTPIWAWGVGLALAGASYHYRY